MTEEKQTFGVKEKAMQEVELEDIEELKVSPDDFDTIAKELFELPFQIRSHERKLLGLARKNDAIAKRTKELTDHIYMGVMNEKEPGQLKYIDQKTIETETTKRLEKSKEYSDLKMRFYSFVAEETDHEGKKKYNNEKQREAETHKRLWESKELKDLNAKITESVSKEQTEGKLKYTNEKQREMAVTRILNEKEENKLLVEEAEKCVENTHTTKSAVDCMKRTFKAYELGIELAKIKLRIG